jgi:glycosidase
MEEFLHPVRICITMMRSACFIAIIFLFTETAFAVPRTIADTTPSWMRKAVIYGIKPSGFVNNSSYDKIAEKIPELKELGINTIWLQPVFKTWQGGQGYDVTDYFSLREDIGTAAQLKNLVALAHRNKIRVLFDFVPNHTSIHHPYAQDVIKNGANSKYYDYYQHENDGAPYSSFYHKDSSGFIYYFWKTLVNLNYDNGQVRNMIIDACKYWIREFDIDGYRFDAVWAVNARAPLFGQQLRKELLSLKPDVLLLAEDKGADPDVFKKGFDAAYDWTADTAWVSHWPWQYQHDARKNFTIFNHPLREKRYELIRSALFAENTHPERILRFMENNDVPRFAASHTLSQTKMAAAILFALPGVPLIYNGQETGVRAHPYSRHAIFADSLSIQQQDPAGLFLYYKRLIALRMKYASLTGASFEEAKVEPQGTAIAFERREGDEHIVVIFNPDSAATSVTLKVNAKSCSDLLSGERFKKSTHQKILSIPLDGYTARWLLLKK